jgi:succinate dehydrogenase/fumarate reductase cytochrome b subunit
MSSSVLIRRVHRTSAAVLGSFVLAHLVNHLAGLRGVEAHVAFMQAARVVYRHPVVETLLLASVVAQALTGMALLRRSRLGDAANPVLMLQRWSGLYLGFFLVVHVAAVMLGRGVHDLDTTWYFAAAGFHVRPFAWFFAPYYGLAVLALGMHVGCALHRRLFRATQASQIRQAALLLPMLGAALAGGLIVSMLAGWLYPVHVPPEYLAPFGG